MEECLIVFPSSDDIINFRGKVLREMWKIVSLHSPVFLMSKWNWVTNKNCTTPQFYCVHCGFGRDSVHLVKQHIAESHVYNKTFHFIDHYCSTRLISETFKYGVESLVYHLNEDRAVTESLSLSSNTNTKHTILVYHQKCECCQIIMVSSLNVIN